MKQSASRSPLVLSSASAFVGVFSLLILGACDSSGTVGDANDVETKVDSSETCEIQPCSEFEKPPKSHQYTSPALELSVDSRNYLGVAVQPRSFMRPNETRQLTWLYSDEAAVIDASFLIDPSDAGRELEPQEFVMYAFVNFKPAPFSVIRAESGKDAEFANEEALADRPLEKYQDVDFSFDEINNYSVRIPPSSFGQKGTKVVTLVIAQANPGNPDKAWNSPGTISRSLEVHFGSEADWRGNLPSVRARNTKVTPALASSAIHTRSLLVPRPPVYEQPVDGSDEELNLNQTFSATSDSISVYNYLVSMRQEELESGRIIVTYLKNRDQVVGESPIRLDADPAAGRDQMLQIERTFKASEGGEPLERLESVRFYIPDRKPILGERMSMGNTLRFE